MGRVTLTFSQNGDEVDPLPKEELKPLSGYELVTLSPLNQSQLFLKEKLSCDWLRGVHIYAKIVHVQEL